MAVVNTMLQICFYCSTWSFHRPDSSDGTPTSSVDRPVNESADKFCFRGAAVGIVEDASRSAPSSKPIWATAHLTAIDLSHDSLRHH